VVPVDALAADAAPAGAPSAQAPSAADELVRIRDEIVAVDRAIVGLIAQRVALARQLGPVKRGLGMPTLDPPREAAVVRRASALAREVGLPEEDVRYVFWHLVGLGRRVQMETE
jgi:chorismate mutase